MSYAFLAAAQGFPTTPPIKPPEAPEWVTPTDLTLPVWSLVIESLDGARRVELDGSTGWTLMPGATGLAMAPIDVVTSSIPGVPGSVIDEIKVQQREIFLPLITVADTQAEHLGALSMLQRVIDPVRGRFRLIGLTGSGQREMLCTYTGGLEGNEGRDEAGHYWRKFGLLAIADQPFAQDRQDRVVEFQSSGGGAPFLNVAGGTSSPWPRALSPSALIGEGMEVRIGSELPVYPTIELFGPMESFTGAMEPAAEDPDTEWSVSIPNGVPAGSVLRLVSDPRLRSYRLDGAPAAGRVARGSTLRPFYPGLNVMSVLAPGSTEESRIRISWRELHWSLWW